MNRITRPLPIFAPLAAMLLVTACGGGGTPTPTATPTPTPTPSPTPTPTSYNVTRCLNQEVAPGVSVASLVVPDELNVNFAAPSGFPNGRKLADPVVDVTLNIIFLDLTKTPATTLASVPVNPSGNDVPLRTEFPYLGLPQGNPPLSPVGGSNFNFRTDAASAYTRVDRMGMPAVATALISSSMKTAYNDANPSDDAAGTFVPEITSTLTGLTNALADDFIGLGLPICAVKN